MIDARLAIPAAAAWLGAVVVQCCAWSIADAAERRVIIGWGAIAVGSLALPVILGLLPAGRRGRSRWGSLPSVALGLAVGVATSAIMVVALAQDPVATWVERRSTATIQGVVSSDPVTKSRNAAAIWQSTSSIEARLDTARVTARGEPVDVALPMVIRVVGDEAERAGTTPIPPVGSLIEVTGRLGPSRASGIAATITISNADAIRVIGGPGLLDSVANAMRSGLQASVRGIDPDAAALIAGLAVGDESLQTPELATAMRDSGLSHLTAVSGGNVAIVLVAVLGLTRIAGLRIGMRVATCLVALAFFVVLVRPQPSVLRASVMGAVVLVGMLGGGRGRGVGVLSTTVLLLVAISPALAVSWGFGLSVAATGGLIVLGPVIEERMQAWPVTRRWPPGWREALGVTLAAQLATLPLLIAMGSSVGWAAIPANLLAMPAVPAITILGLLAALLSPIASPVVGMLAVLAAIPAGWIARVASACSQLPYATIPWPAGWLGVGSLAGACLLAWVLRRRMRATYPTGAPRRTVVTAAIIIIAGFVTIALEPPSQRGWPPPGWLMVACDVGQGDGLVVRVDDGSAIVIDVGPDGDAMLQCLRDLRIEALSAIVLTHFHADHVNGLDRVLAAMPVGVVYRNPVPEPAEQARMVAQALAAHAVPSQVVRAGDVRSIGDVRWEVLWPRRVIGTGSVANNASSVLLMQAAGTSILLPGDIEPEAQVAVMAGLPNVAVDVVKVPHHGSRYQHPRFAAWTHGRIALVSVGAGNDYGHPAQQTLEQWARLGAVVGRTDVDGDLAVVRQGPRLGLVTRGT
ncbi:MAG: DNA internalization-related competence protein ComEC/Rec2 [Actinomycetales bacterium]|nr:DNA internalization-related competence protein ComEC/Rec2 [Actinomycetales bacterium]